MSKLWRNLGLEPDPGRSRIMPCGNPGMAWGSGTLEAENHR